MKNLASFPSNRFHPNSLDRGFQLKTVLSQTVTRLRASIVKAACSTHDAGIKDAAYVTRSTLGSYLPHTADLGTQQACKASDDGASFR
jgi:hypothetical protein